MLIVVYSIVEHISVVVEILVRKSGVSCDEISLG